MSEQTIMILGTYIMAPEHIPTAYLTNLFHLSVCLYAYPFIDVRQCLDKNVTAAAIEELLDA
jgi:hypothetical protein